MNLIFLDVDGVLVSRKRLIDLYNKNKRRLSRLELFNYDCLEKLKILVDETDSVLVISSSWGKVESDRKILLEVLNEFGLDDRVVGYIPVLNEGKKEEIKQYINTLDNDINFIILDDVYSFGELDSYLIRTDNEIGLTMDNVNEGIRILSRNSNK